MNKARLIFVLSCVSALLFVRCSQLPIAGGSSQQGNGVVIGRALSKNGASVSMAIVRIRPNDYFQSIDPSKASAAAVDAKTDGSGNFFFDDVAPGDYSIEINDRETSAVLVKTTVSAGAMPVELGAAILKPFAKIEIGFGNTGQTGQNLYAQVRGLERLIPMGADGRFSAADLPEGVYDFRIIAADSTWPSIEALRVKALSGKTASTLVLNGWRYMRPLYLNTTNSGAGISNNVLNFPALIRLTKSNFTFSQAAINGADIRFLKPDNTSLPFEIERWDPMGEIAEVWVKVDTVLGNDSTRSIALYWGASTSSTGLGASATGSLSSGPSVFDTAAGFQGVWHFSEQSGALAPDATINGFDASPMGSPTPLPTAGIIGNARIFNGTSAYFDMLNSANGKLNFPQHGVYCVSAWVNTASLSGAYQVIASKGDKQYNLEIKGATNEWEFVEYQDTVGWDETTFKASAQSWVFLAGIRFGAKEYLYVNGVCADSMVYNLPFSAADTTYGEIHGLRDATHDFMVGKMNDYPKYFFNGKIDELRVLNIAPSADWIKLCYMNQKEPDALVQF